MTTRDIVFFLGAGFSAGADLPTMPEFGNASRKEYREQERLRNIRKSRDLYYSAGQTFESFRNYCSSAGNYMHIDNGNMEELYCVAEALIESGIEEILLDTYDPILTKNLNEHLRLWLWKIYHRCPIVNEANNMSKPYESFIDCIKEQLDRITVITTNYDLVFEYISWKQACASAYPEVQHVSLPATQNTEEYLASSENEAPVLIKLHGSINFFTSAGEDKLFITKDIIKNGERLGDSGVNSDRPSILPVDALWHLRENKGNKNRRPGIVPAIIPPTYSKLRGHDWLRTMWNRAFESINTAKVIVFIGYSFPDSDGFMKALFQSALANRKSRSDLRIYVIDPCAGIQDTVGINYLRMFSPLQNKLTLIPKSFSTAVEVELPEIVEKNCKF